MTTIKLAILKHQKAKDGSQKIRLAIGHRSETHYIVTPYSINSPSEFDGKRVVRLPNAAQINIELTRMLLDYQERLSRVQNPERYTCTQLRNLLKSMTPVSRDATFRMASDSYIKELTEDGRTGYVRLMKQSQERFLEFSHGDIFLSIITPQYISDYERYLKRYTFGSKRQTYSDTTINMFMSLLRTVINRAIRLQMVRYDINPFINWHRSNDKERELDISIEDMRKMRDVELHGYSYRYARDMFMLSYYLGGINFIDLASYDFRGKDSMDFVRHKSRNLKQGDKRISFTIPPEAYPIIQKYMDKKSGLLLYKRDKNYRYDVLLITIDRNLKKVAEHAGIKDYQSVCWYTARKSFVQHGFDLGQTLEVLEYCIGQSVKTNRPIFNYLRIMRKHADAAIRCILDELAKESGDPHEQPET